MRLTITGSGTSGGVPEIGCTCATCRSADPKDTRYRASAIVQSANACVVIDTGPEFRLQALNYGMSRLDAVLITHAHGDHIHGLNDVRAFCKDGYLPLYANADTLAEIKTSFGYMFSPTTQQGGGLPHLTLTDCAPYSPASPLVIDTLRIIPVPMKHGRLNTTGWRINDTAYLTDLSALPAPSLALLNGIHNLVIDGLRLKPHKTHLSFLQALSIAETTTARRIWLTHIAHDFSHAEITALLRAEQAKRPRLLGRTVEPAYDGLIIEE